MYQYQSSVVRTRAETARWVNEDIQHMTIASVLVSYYKVYLILTNELYPDPLSVDLADCSAELNTVDQSLTIDQWLSGRGNLSLPTVSSTPTVTSKLARYCDAVAAGYHMEPVHPSGNPGGDDVIDPEYVDILFTKEGVDGNLVRDYCLVSVNGFYHRTTVLNGQFVAKDGAESVRLSRQNNVGLVSFKDIGKIDVIGLRPEQVFNPTPNGKLYDEVWIQLDEPIGDRIPFMSIGGYLELPSDLIEVVGPDMLKVKMTKYPYIHRYFTSKKLIDLSAVDATMVKIDNDPDRVFVSELTKDEAIRAYFTLSQTFVVLLEANNLFTEIEKLEYTYLPGRYYMHHRPSGIIKTEFGRTPEYLAFPETGIWVLTIQENLKPIYQFEFDDPVTAVVINDAKYTQEPYVYSAGYHVTIGSDIVTI